MHEAGLIASYYAIKLPYPRLVLNGALTSAINDVCNLVKNKAAMGQAFNERSTGLFPCLKHVAQNVSNAYNGRDSTATDPHPDTILWLILYLLHPTAYPRFVLKLNLQR